MKVNPSLRYLIFALLNDVLMLLRTKKRTVGFVNSIFAYLVYNKEFESNI